MPSKSSVFSLSPDEDMSYLTLSYASVIPTKLVKSDAPSVRFAIMENPGDEPIEGTFPFVARFEAINDVVMIALKQTKNITYAWGVPVDKLIEWVPPRGARDLIDEDAVFVPFKLPNEGIMSVHKLENTSTHKLRDMLDKLAALKPRLPTGDNYSPPPRTRQTPAYHNGGITARAHRPAALSQP